MTELIEKYLLNQLTVEEKSAFEKKLLTDITLQQEVQIQKDLMDAVEFKATQVAIDGGWKKYKLIKIAKSVLIITASIAIATLIATTLLQNPKSQASLIPQTKFKIDNARDTIIETPSGIIVYVPANAIEGASEYDLEISELMNPIDIIKAGVSTLSDSTLLLTAGMFKIDALHGKDTLQFIKELTVQVPTEKLDPNMMLFDGEMQNGKINWTNPKPLQKNLITSNLGDLNFYPPKFLDKLTELGIDANNKQLTDSIYFSFTCYQETETLDSEIPFKLTEDMVWAYMRAHPNERVIGDALKDTKTTIGYCIQDSTTLTSLDDAVLVCNSYYATFLDREAIVSWPQKNRYSLDSEAVISKNQICPAAIQAIQLPEFANTFIATKAFENRLQYLFGLCSDDLLFIYIENLDKDLWISDSLVANAISDSEMKAVFRNFAAQKLGNTSENNLAFSKLSAYHQLKMRAFNLAAQKVMHAKHEELAKLNNSIADKEERKEKMKALNLKTEFDLVWKDVCNQLGINPNKNGIGKDYYMVQVSNSTWKNIDAIVKESVDNKQSANINYNGKTATVVYNKVQVKISNQENFDWIHAYLIVNELPSFQQMSGRSNLFEDRLNQLCSYDLVVMAQKGKHFFYGTQKLENKEQSLSLSLVETSENDINTQINKITSKNTFSLADEFQLQREKRLLEFKMTESYENDLFRSQIMKVIWPCN